MFWTFNIHIEIGIKGTTDEGLLWDTYKTVFNIRVFEFFQNSSNNGKERMIWQIRNTNYNSDTIRLYDFEMLFQERAINWNEWVDTVLSKELERRIFSSNYFYTNEETISRQMEPGTSSIFRGNKAGEIRNTPNAQHLKETATKFPNVYLIGNSNKFLCNKRIPAFEETEALSQTNTYIQ